MSSPLFVHGVPETPAVWSPLIEKLECHNAELLQLPGFGIATPEGFSATRDAYVRWLIDELECRQQHGPVDVVGHDWGGALVLRVAALRPELVRSWVSDGVAVAAPEFKWHDAARLWQTPNEGEAFFAQQLAFPVRLRSRLFRKAGASPDLAAELASAVDQTMIDCILALYRSAIDFNDWSSDFSSDLPPGLALIPSDDAYLSSASSITGAKRLGAAVHHFDDAGHWWMFECPTDAAAALTTFWAGLGEKA